MLGWPAFYPLHPITLIHDPRVPPKIGSNVGSPFLGRRLRGGNGFQERLLDHRSQQGPASPALLVVWASSGPSGSSPPPSALSPPDQERLPKFHFTSSSPNRPEGWSAGRRRGICPGKRASHPHRPQLWERKQEGEQTNHDTAKSLTTSPLKCNNPVSVNNCLVLKHAKL